MREHKLNHMFVYLMMSFRIIIILNLDVISQAPALIGNPVNIENQMQGQALPPVAPLSQTNNSQSNNSQNHFNNSSTQSNSTPSKISQIQYKKPVGGSQVGEPICKDKVCIQLLYFMRFVLIVQP